MTISNTRKQFIADLANDEWIDRLKEDELKDIIFENLSKEWDKKLQDFFASNTPAEELHFFALKFNWDGSLHPLRKLIQHKNCDLNTARLVFWLASPCYLQKFNTLEDAITNNVKESWSLVQLIIKYFVKGHYQYSNMPDDFRKEIAKRPASKPKWSIPSVFYG